MNKKRTVLVILIAVMIVGFSAFVLGGNLILGMFSDESRCLLPEGCGSKGKGGSIEQPIEIPEETQEPQEEIPETPVKKTPEPSEEILPIINPITPPEETEPIGVTMQGKAEIGNPVSWTKTISAQGQTVEEIIAELPQDAENIIIQDMATLSTLSTDSETAPEQKIKIIYETPAPGKDELPILYKVGGWNKFVTINSDATVHYNNVAVETEIPETNQSSIRIYHHVSEERIDVTCNALYEIEFIDQDSNGLAEKIRWTVPQLSEQTFEIESDESLVSEEEINSEDTITPMAFCTCNTCSSCNLNLNSPSCSDGIILGGPISVASGDCISPDGPNGYVIDAYLGVHGSAIQNKVIDCNYNTISGGADGIGVHLQYPIGTTLKNCKIEGFDEALRVSHIPSPNTTKASAYIYNISANMDVLFNSYISNLNNVSTNTLFSSASEFLTGSNIFVNSSIAYTLYEAYGVRILPQNIDPSGRLGSSNNTGDFVRFELTSTSGKIRFNRSYAPGSLNESKLRAYRYFNGTWSSLGPTYAIIYPSNDKFYLNIPYSLVGTNEMIYTLIQDNIAPLTTASPSVALNTWTNSSVTIYFDCNDSINGFSGVGCNTTLYCNASGSSCTPSIIGGSGVITNQGIWNVSYRSNDSVGNLEGIRTSGRIMIDKTAPTTSISTSPTYTNDTWRNLASVSFTLTCGDGNELSGCNIRQYCTSSGCIPSTTYSSPVSISNEGTNYFNFRSIDNAGNVEATHSWVIKLDRTAPTLNLVSPANRTWTNQTTYSFTFNSADTYNSPMNCSLFVDGAYKISNTSTQNNINTNLSTTLTQGTRTWYIVCKDNISNTNTSETRTIYVDTTVPRINLRTPNTDVWINTTTRNFEFNVTDNLAPNVSCTLFVNGVSKATNSSVLNNTNTNLTATGLTTQGANSWYINCTDLTGNRNQSVTRTLNIDSIAPTINLLSPANGIWINQTNYDFKFNATDTYSVPMNCSLYVGGEIRFSNSSVLNNTNTTLSYATLIQGSNNWYINCRDSLGTSSNSITQTLNVDLIPPITTATAVNDTGGTYTNNTTVGANYINVSLNCEDPPTPNPPSGCITTPIKYCNTSDTCVPDTTYSGTIQITEKGTTYLRYSSTDVAGNLESPKTFVITIDRCTDIDGDGFGNGSYGLTQCFYPNIPDCDDFNETVRPLINNSDNYINSSTFVCFGQYNNSHVILNANDIYFDCNNSLMDGYDKDGFGIYATGHFWINVSNCKINNYSAGIFLSSTANYNIVKNNNIYDCATYGVFVSSAHDNIILNNTIYGIPNNGIGLVSNSYNNNITNNFVNNNQYGFVISASPDNNVINNIVKDNGWDFYSEGASTGNKIINMTTNDTNISFMYYGNIKIKDADGTGTLNPIGYSNISHYLNITNQSTDAWIYINVSYQPEDIEHIWNKSLIRIWKHDGTWYNESFVGPIAQAGINIEERYVYANITNFSSIYAPMGEIDIIPPQWSNNLTNPSSPATYAPGQNCQFNITWIDATTSVEEVVFEFNGTNYSYQDLEIEKSGDEYYITISDLAVGNYPYRWYANDSAENWNQNPQLTYVVQQAESYNESDPENGLIHFAINGNQTESYFQFVNGTIVNATGWKDNPPIPDGMLNLLLNGTPIDTDADRIENISIPNVGEYNFTLIFNNSQNYSDVTITKIVNITKNCTDIDGDGFGNGSFGMADCDYPDVPDCNDFNEIVRPLVNNTYNYINNNTIVCNGYYNYSHVQINASNIYFDCNNSILDGYDKDLGFNHSGINLSNKNNVNISNCELINYNFGVYLSNTSTNTIIQNNLTDCNDGIFLQDTSFTNVTNNNCTTLGACILVVDGSSHNTVLKNTASYCEKGIYLFVTSDNKIFNNTIKNSDVGITLYPQTNYTILADNYIDSSELDGLQIDTAFNNVIYNTTIFNSSYYGIEYASADVNANNTIYNSNISNNAYGIIVNPGYNLNWIINETGYAENNPIDLGAGNIIVTGTGTLTLINTSLNNSNTNIAQGGTMTYRNSKDTNIISGNLSISGNYTLDNSTLKMNCSINGSCGITATATGNMVVGNNSIIQKWDDTTYKFVVYSPMKIDNSWILDVHSALMIYSNWNNLTNSRFISSNTGLYLSSSSNNLIQNNTQISGGGFGAGISLIASQNNIIDNNVFPGGNLQGIGIQSSSNSNNITRNRIYNNAYRAIFISASSNNTVYDNTLYNNDASWIATNMAEIVLNNATYNNLTKNIIYEHNYRGIHLVDSSNNIVNDNFIFENEVGINLIENSVENLIYNNFFNNTVNAQTVPGNYWNISVSPGPNIIGGLNISGNYWSDYLGYDRDEPADGIGNTMLPYELGNPDEGDFGPLTNRTNTLPNATNVNVFPDYPKTTQNLNCSFTITDNRETSLFAYVTWYNNSNPTSIFDTMVSCNNNSTCYTDKLVNSSNTTKGENWTCEVIPYDDYDNGTAEIGWEIINNSAPVIVQNQTYTDLTNHTFLVAAFVTDADGLTDISGCTLYYRNDTTWTSKAGTYNSSNGKCTAQISYSDDGYLPHDIISTIIEFTDSDSAKINTSLGNRAIPNEVPKIASINLNESYVKNGTPVFVISSGAQDTDSMDNYTLMCGTISDVFDLCNSTLGTGERNCTFIAPWLGGGIQTIYCRLNDTFNVSQQVTFELVSDNMAPDITILIPSVNWDVLGGNISLTASIIDKYSVDSAWYEIINLTDMSTTKSGTLSNTTLDIWKTLWETNTSHDGNYTFIVYANDSLGNGPANSSRNFTVNNTETIINFNDLDLKHYHNSSFNLNITFENLIRNISIASYEIFNSTHNNLQSNSTSGINAQFFEYTDNVPSSSFEDGLYNITANTTDDVANLNEKDSWFVFDRINPEISYQAPTPNNEFTNSTEITVNASVYDLNGNKIVFKWNTAIEQQDYNRTLGGVQYLNITRSGLLDGNYTFVANMTDLAGNSNQTEERWVFIDTTGPTVTILFPEEDYYNNSILDLNYTAIDEGCGVSSCWYSINGGENISLPGCNNSTITIDTMNENNVTVYANDTLGNTGSDTVVFYLTCITPHNDLYINQNTTLCPGTYQINDSEADGLIIINNSSIELNCNYAYLIGDKKGYAIYNNGRNNTIIENCIAENYSVGIYLDVDSNYNEIFYNDIYSCTNGIYINQFSEHNTLASNYVENSTAWDFYSEQNTTNNTIINILTENTASNFNYSGELKLKNNDGVSAPNPIGYSNISHYLNISGTEWIDIEMFYEEEDWSNTQIINESTIRLWKHDGAWTEILDSDIDIDYNYVYANITNPRGLFAPMGAIDEDGDGFDYLEDCDDLNETIRPLVNDSENYINSDIIVCYGPYSNPRLILDDSGSQIDCNGSSLIGTEIYDAIYTNQGDGSEIKNCNIEGYRYGIHLRGPSNYITLASNNFRNLIYGVYMRGYVSGISTFAEMGGSDYGIQAGPTPTTYYVQYVNVTNNTFDNVSSSATYSYLARYIELNQNNFANSTIGLSVSRTNSFDVINNTFANNGNLDDGYYLDNGGVILNYDTNGVFVFNNTFINNYHFGILDEGINNILQENRIENNTGITDHTGDGLFNYGVYSTGSNPQIINNTIRNVSAGIFTETGSNITENKIENTNTGIYASGSYTDITKNQIENTTQNGIVLLSSIDGTIEDNNISIANYGLFLEDSDNNLFSNITMNNVSNGASMSNSNQNEINNLLITNVSLMGLEVSFDSDENVFTNIKLNNETFNFTGQGIDIKNIASVPTISASTYKAKTNRALNISKNNPDGWIFLNLSYAPRDVQGTNITSESTLRFWKNNGTWIEVPDSEVDTIGKYVYGNISDFSIIAIVGNLPRPVSSGGGIGGGTTPRGIHLIACREDFELYNIDKMLPGEIFTAFEDRFCTDLHFYQIIAEQEINNSEIQIELVSPEVIPPEGKVYEYYNVTTKGIEPENLREIKFRYRVPKEWADESGINIEKVVLYRQKGVFWEKLDSEYLREDEVYYNYEANSKEFSYYVTVGQTVTMWDVLDSIDGYYKTELTFTDVLGMLNRYYTALQIEQGF